MPGASGATRALGFNSRTREGCDMASKPRARSRLKFQFTHPGGVRLNQEVWTGVVLKFQFTHPGGVRP